MLQGYIETYSEFIAQMRRPGVLAHVPEDGGAAETGRDGREWAVEKRRPVSHHRQEGRPISLRTLFLLWSHERRWR